MKDVKEEDVLIFKKGEVYKIVGFDYNSLVYYVEPEYDEEHLLPDEFVVSALHNHFEFLIL
ncbi:hypothetical protein [Bacillus sp. M6-12]|uniref:hypothetical protein n=1 Tax=Bacillus sp. M6-12 TaxID=2054166 RepID=UPI00115A0586|nr:hypothetical protein [Bacillus sp. M6-12]